MPEIYEKIASSLAQQGYIVLQNAFGAELCGSLLESAKTKTYKRAGISKGASVDANRRRDSIVWLDAEDEAQREYLERAKSLREYLNRSLYLGLKYYEAHFARYREGDFYEKHLDSFRHSKNRVVTTVYYLNEEWSGEDGGELCMYDEEGALIEEVLPKADTLVVFLSERFPHEVKVAKKERYSIAGWYRVDTL